MEILEVLHFLLSTHLLFTILTCAPLTSKPMNPRTQETTRRRGGWKVDALIYFIIWIFQSRSRSRCSSAERQKLCAAVPLLGLRKKGRAFIWRFLKKKGNKKASQRTNSQPQRTNIWPNGQVKSPNRQGCPLPVKHLRKKNGIYTKIRWIAFSFAFLYAFFRALTCLFSGAL